MFVAQLARMTMAIFIVTQDAYLASLLLRSGFVLVLTMEASPAHIGTLQVSSNMVHPVLPLRGQ
jgi:hypothetical protein